MTAIAYTKTVTTKAAADALRAKGWRQVNAGPAGYVMGATGAQHRAMLAEPPPKARPAPKVEVKAPAKLKPKAKPKSRKRKTAKSKIKPEPPSVFDKINES